ncbi:Cys/Met metabolism PLP-dependent enzyme-domain-containing protein [Auriculariales sp. MPI-PUGE-AT-0066]|nr:Cys/Met metabolism PLP-dependent enzyme-domain-containing protein [Auriculariales sp. MPI-PUGE-AT-0066]
MFSSIHSASSSASSSSSDYGFGTRLIHVGSEPDPITGAVIPPISLSTTFKQDAPGIYKGYDYSRSDNPNRNALERLLSSIESGGGRALTFASGSAATASLLQALGPNSHIISIDDVYGGTNRYMRRVAAEVQALAVDFLDLANASDEQVLAAIRPDTKLIWVESPTNPTLRLVDLPRLAKLVKSTPARPLILVDNTFLSPFYASPLKLGADIVLHSMTKYVNGHSDVVMGALVFPPPASNARLDALYDRTKFIQNAFGAVPSAHDAWLLQRGAKTLHLRMRAHGLNALTSPTRCLRSSQYFDRARHVVEQSEGGSKLLASLQRTNDPALEAGVPFGGVVSFWLRGGERETRRFLARLRLFALAESLGGVESLAEAPAVMTHASVPREQRERLGISDGLVRLSDLLADVLQALEYAVQVDDEVFSSGSSVAGDQDSLPVSTVATPPTAMTSVDSLALEEKKA